MFRFEALCKISKYLTFCLREAWEYDRKKLIFLIIWNIRTKSTKFQQELLNIVAIVTAIAKYNLKDNKTN